MKKNWRLLLILCTFDLESAGFSNHPPLSNQHATDLQY